MVQLAASIILIVIGLAFALVLDIARDMQIFGWVLAVLGVLGIVTRVLVARARDGREPPGPL